MKNLFFLGLIIAAGFLISCGNEEKGGGEVLANEVSLSGAASLSVVEKDTTVVLTYEFTVPTRQAGSLVVSATVVDLTYGANYSTSPAEDAGSITIPFELGASSASLEINVNDDDLNLPNGTVTFTLSEVEGETATISGTAAFALTIVDNEGESIEPVSTDVVKFGEVVPESQSAAVEVSFTSLNLVADISAVASSGFVVGATADGEFASTATLASSATSFFVKAAPDAAAAFGLLEGTVTLSSGEAEVAFAFEAIVSSTIGVLFWAENFDYPVDDTYPSYGDNGYSGAIVPVSAYYRLGVVYNGADASLAKITGLARTGFLDTWLPQTRIAGIAMGDSPLNFTGYPNAGVGRSLKLAKDGSNQQQRNDCNTESKNGAVIRRFVDDGAEIKEGNVYLSSMIKVNEVFPEATPVLKNAIIMLTGDASFVGINAMKVNVREDGAGGFNFGVSKSGDDGTVVYGSTSYTLGETYAIVMKVEIKADLEGDLPNDVVSLYVFKEGDAIPAFESSALTPEAVIDATNQGADVHDVTTGLETVFIREVADDFAAGGAANNKVQHADFDGIRVATSWTALFKDASEAVNDNVTSDPLQTMRYGNVNCSGFAGGNKGNNDL